MASDHEKKRLAQPVILTKSRYIGFARTPVRDDSMSAQIQGLPAPKGEYELRDGGRWVDMRKRGR